MQNKYFKLGKTVYWNQAAAENEGEGFTLTKPDLNNEDNSVLWHKGDIITVAKLGLYYYIGTAGPMDSIAEISERILVPAEAIEGTFSPI